ncbi:CYFA0S02e07360g1_1 [Cyberlindnera fabianii]|uniref:Acyl-coenzyme A oxidase n=1 Tax=Cyberlindnera fabianii TaxID=36022 RepID=A0A061AVW0_CYBFA|nr:CYFA0S02e07360g1_1 [Cyberlindnera fabianii]
MSLQEMCEEREKCSFNTRELTYFLDGGKDKTLELEEMMTSFERDPIFKVPTYDLSWKEQREMSFKRITRMVPFLSLDGEEKFNKRMGLLAIIDGATYTRLGVHFGLFTQTVRALGTPEQFTHWCVDKGGLKCSKFFGCFGMTELTHGSNVAGLQTLATYDEDDGCFLIHTPHLGATKWWIGGAAHSATHCVVYARLIVKGKDYGTKNFVVQLRDVNTHELLPGIAIGDIGKKMGRDGIDNGWIQFTHVRIPRFNMLSKYTSVDDEGNVSKPKFAEQLGYTALVMGRVTMVYDSYTTGKRFITIALRYAAMRRQFGNDGTGKEKKIIDYTHHRRRLFPLLASVFALNASSAEVEAFQKKAQESVLSGDMDKALPNLKDLFALSAGMKAFGTWETCKIIDEGRQSCGGHGYSGYNGFGQGYNDWVVQCTWEGDNNVLSLSCGRALIQNYLALEKGEKLGDYSKYLANYASTFELKTSQLEDIEQIISAWEFISQNLVKKATTSYKNFLKASGNQEDAFEKVSSNRFEIAKIHTKLITLKTFYSRVQKAKAEIKPVLTLLCQLYALSITVENIGQLYSFGVITGSDFTQQVNFKIDEINEKLRPDIVGITDSFNLSDFFIASQIGKKQGGIYEEYFYFVNSQTGKEQIPYYYETVFKPYLHRSLEQNDNED